MKSRRLRWARHVACKGEERGLYRVLVGKPEGKRPPGSPRRRWEDDIKTDLQEEGCEGVEWIELAQDRYILQELVNAVMSHRFPLNSGIFFTSCKPASFLRRTLFHGVWCG
jgi:hypothetical protein